MNEFCIFACCEMLYIKKWVQYWGRKHMYSTVKPKMNVFMQESYTYIHACMGVLVVLCAYVGELHG